MEKSEKSGTLQILLSGTLWGSMGIFVHALSDDFGLTSMQIACARFTLATLAFAVILFFKDKSAFKVRLRDVPLFFATGLVSVLAFSWCYFTAIQQMTMSMAAILLYTSPIWVMLLSAVLFKEKITAKKIVALILAFGGCVCVSGGGGGKMTLLGLLTGLGAGLGYGLYSIFSTFLLRRYSPLTVTTYAFAIGTIGAWILCDPADLIAKVTAAPPVSIGFWIVACCIVTEFFPYLMFTNGLRSVPASRAAIIATIEPVVATIIGILRGEPMTFFVAVGVVAVISAILVLNIQSKQKEVAE